MTLALALALLLALGFVCQWAAWRMRLPAILPLLLAGIVLGPISGVLDPDALLGELLFPLVSLGVAVILFEGSLTLRFSEVRGLAPAILNLVSVGALLTAGGLALAAHHIAGLDWPLALLFGALGSVTGPTVIVPMLRSVRPTERIANVLRWEGIIIDPVGALLAVLVFEAVMLGHGDDGLWVFARAVASGAAIGLVAAFSLAAVLRRHWIPEYLHNYGTLALVLLAFTTSNVLTEESGLLAVTVMGMTLANLRGLHMEDILDFKEHLSTLLISMLFILLAARLEWFGAELLLAGSGILLVAMLAVRPAVILIATLGSSLSWRERALLAWIAPRGIVAAAVSALFALKLDARGFEQADALVALTFLLIIGTVTVQSATARGLARRLGVSEPEPRGVLIVGSSPLALAIGEALARQGFPPLIADEDWHGIREARMKGLRTFLGNPVSEHADRRLDLVGLGWLLALSERPEANTLACVRYRPEFGRERTLRLRLYKPGEAPRQAHSEQVQTPALFGAGLTHEELSGRLSAGWHIRTTRLTADYDWDAFQARHREPPLLLFAVDDGGRLRLQTEDLPLEPRPGWSVTCLVEPAGDPGAGTAQAGVETEPAAG